MKEFGKVAVIFGGDQSEREVSLLSGQAVLDALLSKGVDAYAFDTAKQSLSQLEQDKVDRVFIVLHGDIGENGVLQGALETLKIPYTGCGVTASAIGMDKYLSKLLWQAVQLPVPDFYLLNDHSDFTQIEKDLGLPLFIKPTNEGSSVGVIKIKHPGELVLAYQDLAQKYQHILAEKFIGGGEYACTVLNNQALPVVKIIPKAEFYDYEAKYLSDDTEYLCPADLSAEDEALMQEIALKAFKQIGGQGWARVDFLKDQQGKFYLLELNTVPGMTSHSLVPKAARQIGLSFADLCIEILKDAE